MSEYGDIWYHSADGLKLYARDYACTDPAIESPQLLLCMHGLTRNSADFARLAARLRDRYRVVAVDVRGRGRSDYDSNSANYNPAVYAQDMLLLLDELGADKAILCGTSMGGLMSLVMAALQGQRVSAMILNDIGPEVDQRGLERIKAYFGKARPVGSWEEAAAQVREVNGAAFPEYTDTDWMSFARALYREEGGVPVLAYDPAISEPVAEDDAAAVPADLWPLFAACATIPMLVIRGELSDILAPGCVQSMHAKKPDLQSVEIPGRGHAPSLDEPAAIAAIDSFLAGLH